MNTNDDEVESVTPMTPTWPEWAAETVADWRRKRLPRASVHDVEHLSRHGRPAAALPVDEAVRSATYQIKNSG